MLKAYAEKLRQLGVKDVSIADAADEVQASTNPKNVGKRAGARAKRRGPKEYVIKGVLGDETGPPGSQTHLDPHASRSWWATGASATC